MDGHISVAELNSCLQTLGAAFYNVDYIEVAYGQTEHLDKVCSAFGYGSYSTTYGLDLCPNGPSDTPAMYPGPCNFDWLPAAKCHNGCANDNYGGFNCSGQPTARAGGQPPTAVPTSAPKVKSTKKM